MCCLNGINKCLLHAFVPRSLLMSSHQATFLFVNMFKMTVPKPRQSSNFTLFIVNFVISLSSHHREQKEYTILLSFKSIPCVKLSTDHSLMSPYYSTFINIFVHPHVEVEFIKLFTKFINIFFHDHAQNCVFINPEMANCG